MFRESNLEGSASGVTGGEGALRHPDGTINFDAYREKARRARTEAIRCSVTKAFSLVGREFTAGQ